MPNHRILINEGEKFHRLVALRPVAILGHKGELCWEFKCDCGNTCVASVCRVKSGNNKSCGCMKVPHRHTAKGKRSPTWMSWYSMLERCYYVKQKEYKYWGGRGITVCDRWKGDNGFRNFLADMGIRPEGKTLDRYPNPDGNYEPGNCRWATWSEQNRNKTKKLAA